MPTESEINALREQVFAPGNLAHGAFYRNMGSYFSKGITTPERVRVKETSTPHQICMALLSDLPLPERYAGAWHNGPRSIDGFTTVPLTFGIMISGRKLLERHREKVTAVGHYFTSREFYHDKLQNYSFNCSNDTVFGIPTDRGRLLGRHVDEVRLTDEDDQIFLNPDIWEGFTMMNLDPANLPVLFRRNIPALPVFSPNLQLLSPNLAEEVTKHPRSVKQTLKAFLEMYRLAYKFG